MPTGLSDSFIRIVIPDSHGSYIDWKAAKAMVADIKILRPRQIVWLGDHVDVSGIYSSHPPNYVKDREYSYEHDLAYCDKFLGMVEKAAPHVKEQYYLEGNHEQHVERFIARTTNHAGDAKAALAIQAPERRLRLNERGIRYVKRTDYRNGLSVPGTIKLGKAYFTHGFTSSRFATAQHVTRYGNNVVHGHTHRVQEHGTRTVAADAIGGWCPGTLSILQPLYQHTNPTEWRHGYGLEAVSRDGRFIHINVPIINGWSGLQTLLKTIKPEYIR